MSPQPVKYVSVLIVARHMNDFIHAKSYAKRQFPHADMVQVESVATLEKYDPKCSCVYFSPFWFGRRDWKQIFTALEEKGFFAYLTPEEGEEWNIKREYVYGQF